MNGKTLKVVEYNLTFGGTDRLVNVFGFFKYLKNGNLYLIFTDIDTKYEIVYYGTGHKKNNNLLSMSCKEDEIEIIKEYIYKVTNNEPLENFEIYPLDDITGLELISSNKLEIKLDVIRKLEELTIPKKETKKEEETTISSSPKKTNLKISKSILSLILVLTIMGGGYFFLTTIMNSDKITKTISCTKTSQDNTINATLEENNIYSFTSDNKLKTVNETKLYKFIESQDYENFINNGSVYNYMPKHSKTYTPNNENFTIEYVANYNIDSSYKEPTDYETVITYYTIREYSCNEKIEK